MKRMVVAVAGLLAGCSRMATYRQDTSFIDNTTTVCVRWNRYAGEQLAMGALDTAVASICIPGGGPVAAADPERTKKDGDDVLCLKLRCQATLLAGQRTPAAK